MEENKIEIDCPLGNKCEYIKDNIKHTCVLYTTRQLKHNVTGEIKEEKMCAWVLTPIVINDNSQLLLGNQQAIESFRNELLKFNENLFKFGAMIGQKASLLENS